MIKRKLYKAKGIYAYLKKNKNISVQLWTPAQITTDLWLDADDNSTIQLNGSNVVQWSDKSGNNRHATESTAANQPAFIASGINSKPSLDWGSSQTKRLGWDSGSIDTTWREVFVVAEWISTDTTFPGYNGLFTGFFQVGSSNGHVFIGSIGSANWYPDTIMNEGIFINGSNTNSLVAFETIKQPFVLRGSAPTTNQVRGYRVGGFCQYIGNDWVGRIGEVVSFSTPLSSDNRQKIEGYLAHKWGTVANLPVDHPYKINPPTI